MNCRNCGKENPGPLCNFCGALTPAVALTIDGQCDAWARSAFYCAEQLALGVAGQNTMYGFRIRIPALADRIIAARREELARDDLIRAENYRNAQFGIPAL